MNRFINLDLKYHNATCYRIKCDMKNNMMEWNYITWNGIMNRAEQPCFPCSAEFEEFSIGVKSTL